jgi:hypothetical protein
MSLRHFFIVAANLTVFENSNVVVVVRLDWIDLSHTNHFAVINPSNDISLEACFAQILTAFFASNSLFEIANGKWLTLFAMPNDPQRQKCIPNQRKKFVDDSPEDLECRAHETSIREKV